MQGTLKLPFETAADMEKAATFINLLISQGSAVFTAEVEDNELTIEFSGGF